ncbi:MAG: cupin domain-containing protein [Spirochaetes bacterium]|nr:cupin domain-containing protein [Spirochaetota bacterium]MCK5093806.1 cupin domain-containing protein [Spirochaetota bacterium]
MHKINIDEIPSSGINRIYMKGVSIRYLVVEEFGAPNFEMRYFELQKGGKTSLDEHPHEHEVFILKGKGKMLIGDKEYSLRPNDAVLVEPNEKHRFFQEGDEPFGFICVVPNGVSQSKKKVDLGY